MNLLIDIGHPAHVHLFKNFYYVMSGRGHTLIVTVKNIPSAITLLKSYNMPFIVIGNKRNSIFAKAFDQIRFNTKLYLIVRKYSIDIGLGSTITLAHISRISPMRSIIFDDDDDSVEPLMVRYGHPYADCVISPDVIEKRLKARTAVYYPGFHELAYLHPKYFSPDSSVLKDAGLSVGERYFVMRFNAFVAHHDQNTRGLDLKQKLELVKLLQPHGKIFITTEQDIEPELEQYQLKIPPEKIHAFLTYSHLFIGDSQTMSSEAAILGVPSFRCNSFAGSISYLEELEKRYKLTFGFKPQEFEHMKSIISRSLQNDRIKAIWGKRKKKLLEDKVSLTDLMVWIVEKFPESIRILQKQPEVQKEFILSK